MLLDLVAESSVLNVTELISNDEGLKNDVESLTYSLTKDVNQFEILSLETLLNTIEFSLKLEAKSINVIERGVVVLLEHGKKHVKLFFSWSDINLKMCNN